MVETKGKKRLQNWLGLWHLRSLLHDSFLSYISRKDLILMNQPNISKQESRSTVTVSY